MAYGKISAEVMKLLAERLKDGGPLQVEYEQALLKPTMIIHDYRDGPPTFTWEQSAYERKLQSIIELEARYAFFYGGSRLTPFGQRLWMLFEDLGIFDVSHLTYISRWQMMKRTFYRWVLNKEWWPDVGTVRRWK